jgi:dTDP-4-dehydrorhamnose 3,5-epimerase
MKKTAASIEGLFVLDNFHACDRRGAFVKIMNADHFAAEGLEHRFPESYYSCSAAGVIRGMHFQLPPFDMVKLVTLLRGRALDVVFDLRRNSPTFGKTASFLLDGDRKESLYIPVGCAHGFCALDDDALMLYQVGTVYHPEADAGFRYDSFGFDWPTPAGGGILSERDLSLPPLDLAKTPF